MNENLSVRAENIDRYERIFSSDTTSSSSTSSSSIAPTFAVSTSTVPTNRDFGLVYTFILTNTCKR